MMAIRTWRVKGKLWMEGQACIIVWAGGRSLQVAGRSSTAEASLGHTHSVALTLRS
jgi:hypothetical protein